MKDLEKLLEALKTIHHVCAQQEECRLCPLGDASKNCILSKTPPTIHWRPVDKVPVVRLFEEDA